MVALENIRANVSQRVKNLLRRLVRDSDRIFGATVAPNTTDIVGQRYHLQVIFRRHELLVFIVKVINYPGHSVTILLGGGGSEVVANISRYVSSFLWPCCSEEGLRKD